MQYELILTGKFKKSLKLAKKRGLDLKLLDKVITMLQNDNIHDSPFLNDKRYEDNIIFALGNSCCRQSTNNHRVATSWHRGT